MEALDSHHLPDILISLGLQRGLLLASPVCRQLHAALREDMVWACWLMQEFSEQRFLIKPHLSARDNVIRLWSACCDAVRGRKLLYRGLWTQGNWEYACNMRFWRADIRCENTRRVTQNWTETERQHLDSTEGEEDGAGECEVSILGEIVWTLRNSPNTHLKSRIGTETDTATEVYTGTMTMQNGRIKDGLLCVKGVSVTDNTLIGCTGPCRWLVTDGGWSLVNESKDGSSGQAACLVLEDQGDDDSSAESLRRRIHAIRSEMSQGLYQRDIA